MTKRVVALAGLFALAVAVGVLSEGPRDDPTPVLANHGPSGLAVLGVLLERTQRVVRHHTSLVDLPTDVATVVLTAPAHAELGANEVESLIHFVEGGGTVVYLAAREGVPQPALHRWLGLRWANAPAPNDDEGVDDPGGTTLKVSVAGGILAGARQLRVVAGRAVSLERDDAVEVARPGVWAFQQGLGEVWVFSGADVAQNARLDLADNVVPWVRLAARGPVLVDEFHHLRAALPPRPLNLSFALVQFTLVALGFVLVFGARLGPARPQPTAQQRSAAEYVRAMGRLAEGAGVDDEAITQVRASIRALLHERMGIASTMTWNEAVAVATVRAPVIQRDLARLQHTRGFVEASALAASITRALG